MPEETQNQDSEEQESLKELHERRQHIVDTLGIDMQTFEEIQGKGSDILDAMIEKYGSYSKIDHLTMMQEIIKLNLPNPLAVFMAFKLGSFITMRAEDEQGGGGGGLEALKGILQRIVEQAKEHGGGEAPPDEAPPEPPNVN